MINGFFTFYIDIHKNNTFSFALDSGISFLLISILNTTLPSSEISNSIRSYLLMLFQLALLFLIAHFFNLEKETQLYKLLAVTFIGFGVHYWLPKKWKMPFFLVISFCSIFFIIGFLSGIYLIGIGLLLITLCHLPISYKKRVLLISLAVFVLILVRLTVIRNVELSIVIPFIGTLFMLRLILYVYDLKYQDNYENLWTRISYFFMLPNICFPLFPLIDYKVFENTYDSNPTIINYNLALKRIFRGIIHLLTYKFLYFFVVPDTARIETIYDFLLFLIFSYTLVLRLTGMFHLILGILGLFGFNLPPIFNNIFFASSFSDLWRRINIYWREALMKLVYYPVYFILRDRHKRYAIIGSVILVFIFNWFLHGYQMLWITGFFPITPNDILFWFLFGVVVLANTIYLKAKPHQKKKDTLISEFLLVLKTILMFLFMCLMWLLWSSSSLSEFNYLLSFLLKGTLEQWSQIGVGFCVFLSICFLLHISYKRGVLKTILLEYEGKMMMVHVSISIMILALSIQTFQIPSIIINEKEVIPYLQNNILSTNDKRSLERGYYQTMLNADQTAMQLWGNQFKQPKTWFTSNEAISLIENSPYRTLKPNKNVSFKGEDLITNSYGLRDKEYLMAKPAGSYRYVLLGGSYEMGSGVANEETFENVTEDLLNANKNKIEILNTALGGYHLVENVAVAKNTLALYAPDAIIYTAHTQEYDRAMRKVAQLIKTKAIIEDENLLNIVLSSGAKHDMSRLEVEHRLQPYKLEILKWGYQTIYNEAQKENTKAIWLFLPAVSDTVDLIELKDLCNLVKCIGYTCLTLENVYQDYTTEELSIAPWDTHPNAKGHRLIAELLYEKLQQIEAKRQ